MALPYEERNSAVKTRRQQEDQRRMEFRRAIEDRCERRQLLAEIGERSESTFGRLHRQLPVETLNQRADLRVRCE
jgi:uncharacterized FAD-dependent dehydrogenase